MKLETTIALVGFFASLSSIVFSYLAFKRSNAIDQKSDGKKEGVIFSDIGYIKACVDRVEKNLTKVDERYKDVLQRLSKVEETVKQQTKQ